MDLSSEIEQQAFQDDIRLDVKDPGLKCVSLESRIVSILESIKVSVGFQDEFGAVEGGWPTPVMDRVRGIVGHERF